MACMMEGVKNVSTAMGNPLRGLGARTAFPAHRCRQSYTTAISMVPQRRRHVVSQARPKRRQRGCVCAIARCDDRRDTRRGPRGSYGLLMLDIAYGGFWVGFSKLGCIV
jgi:hypothetical protein